MSHTVHYTPPESPLRFRPVHHYTFRPHHTYLLPELWEHEHGHEKESSHITPRTLRWSRSLSLQNNVRALRGVEHMT